MKLTVIMSFMFALACGVKQEKLAVIVEQDSAINQEIACKDTLFHLSPFLDRIPFGKLKEFTKLIRVPSGRAQLDSCEIKQIFQNGYYQRNWDVRLYSLHDTSNFNSIVVYIHSEAHFQSLILYVYYKISGKLVSEKTLWSREGDGGSIWYSKSQWLDYSILEQVEDESYYNDKEHVIIIDKRLITQSVFQNDGTFKKIRQDSLFGVVEPWNYFDKVE